MAFLPGTADGSEAVQASLQRVNQRFGEQVQAAKDVAWSSETVRNAGLEKERIGYLFNPSHQAAHKRY